MMNNMLLKPGQPIKTMGRNLAGLWRPSFVKVDQRLYVFGGGGNVTDDLHYLDLKNMRWETIQVLTKIFLSRLSFFFFLWLIFNDSNFFYDRIQVVHLLVKDMVTQQQDGEIQLLYLV